MSGSMTATRLRIILLASIVLIIAAITGGFFYAHRYLTEYATQISQLNADASSGDQNINTLRNLETKLDDEESTIQAARSIVADSNTFAEQVVTDVTRIAAQSGVTITALEYVDTASTTAPATSTPTPAAPGVSPTAGVAPASGVAQKSLSVSIESPVDYTKLLNFIKNIESNNLKLQIAKVSLTKQSGNLVGTESFSIGAYVR